MRGLGVLLIVCGPVLAVMVNHAGGGRFLVFLMAILPAGGVALYVIGSRLRKRRTEGKQDPRRGAL